MSFDALAPWYGSLEWIAFGDQLQRCRTACLAELPSPQRALIVGEGNGKFLCALLRMHPGVEVDCVDASARMLDLARERIQKELPGRLERVRFWQEDIRSWKPPEQGYDLIVTHFVLDCFPEEQLAAVVQNLARAGTNDAVWLLADFCIPEEGANRWRARIWLAVMYKFFRVTTGIDATELIDPTPFMQAEGFKGRQCVTADPTNGGYKPPFLDASRSSFGGMLKSQIWRKHR